MELKTVRKEMTAGDLKGIIDLPNFADNQLVEVAAIWDRLTGGLAGIDKSKTNANPFFQWVGVQFPFRDNIKVTAEDIHTAFALDWKGFEDSVQYAVAESNNFNGTVTRNMQGFDNDAIKIFTPEEICKYVEEKLKE